MSRPHCQHPDNCAAKGKRHCPKCAGWMQANITKPFYQKSFRSAMRSRQLTRVVVPDWVPEHLKSIFKSQARTKGEEAAASYVRRLKNATREATT